MRFPTYKLSLSLLLLVSLVSCQPTTSTISPDNSATTDEPADAVKSADDTKAAANNAKAPSAEADTREQTQPSAKEPIFPALQPGQYCYTTKTKTDTIDIRLTIDTADRVTGEVQGNIHNEAAGYYTGYRQAVDGLIDGNNLNVDVATWIEYDRQNKQETWKISDDSLTLENNTLTKESCEVVSKVFQNEEGLEASDLTSGANRIKTEQVYFDSGKNSTTVSNAVVRGDRDVYVVTAQGGQQMTLAISALEDNAVFDVISPSNIILASELTQSELLLPHTGDYQIIVGGTRGNATYDLDIGIE